MAASKVDGQMPSMVRTPAGVLIVTLHCMLLPSVNTAKCGG
jgi:hypothetical protein